MTRIDLTYRFLVTDDPPQTADDFWVLLFHEVLYDAPKRVNFAGWFSEDADLYTWMAERSAAPTVDRTRPLTWPTMTVERGGSDRAWTVTIEGHPARMGQFGLSAVFG